MKSKLRNIGLFGSLLFAAVSIGGCSMNTNTAASPAATQEFVTDSADADITTALQIVKQAPDLSPGYVRIASVYIRKARETGDFSLNTKAESAVTRALEIDPENMPALKLKASLLATLHRFDEARDLGEKLQKVSPDDAFIYGVLTDAYVEMGNYKEAIATAQKMVDLKPNTASYARIAHLRSLHGDHAGAVKLLILAARASDPQDKESQSWCLVQLGKEYFKMGDLSAAEKSIDESLQISPGHPLALIEKGRIQAARGDYDEALQYLTRIQFPSSEKLILSGDINFKMGRTDEAERNYSSAEELARQSEGDMHRFSLLWADHGMRMAEALGIAEQDYETNKDIYAADIYAWCLLKSGRVSEAKEVIKKAMRLGSKDARILYHAGMIEEKLGNRHAAIRLLKEALKLNRSFDLLQAENAETALQKLKSGDWVQP